MKTCSTSIKWNHRGAIFNIWPYMTKTSNLGLKLVRDRQNSLHKNINSDWRCLGSSKNWRRNWHSSINIFFSLFRLISELCSPMSGTWRAPKYVPTQNGPFTTDFLLGMHVARTQYAVCMTSTLLVYLQYLFILRYIYIFKCIYIFILKISLSILFSPSCCWCTFHKLMAHKDICRNIYFRAILTFHNRL